MSVFPLLKSEKPAAKLDALVAPSIQQLPIELWRLIAEYSDPVTHFRLRSACLLLYTYLPRNVKVSATLYFSLVSTLKRSSKGIIVHLSGFQDAVHLVLTGLSQRNYDDLCKNWLDEQLLRLLSSPEACRDIDIASKWNTAIRVACREGRVDIVEWLLSDPRVNPSALCNEALRWAARKGRTDIVRLLVNDGRCDPAAFNMEAFRVAAELGFIEIVKILIDDDRVDPGAVDNYAIRLASQNGHLEVVETLLRDSRVDPSARDCDALCQANANGHSEVVSLLRTKIIES